MRYKISATPIRIKVNGKNRSKGKIVYGYHRMPLDPNGNPLQKYPDKVRLCADRQEAAKLLATYKQQLAIDERLTEYVTCELLLSRYLNHLTTRFECREIKKSHYDDSSRYIRHFIGWLKAEFNRPALISEIRTGDIDNYLLARKRASINRIGRHGITFDGKSGAMAARKALKCAFAYAKKNKYITENPVIDADKWRCCSRDTVAPSTSACQRLFDALPTNTFTDRTFRNLLFMVLGTGARGASVRNLRVKDLQLREDGSTIFFRENKDNEEHEHPLEQAAQSAYEEQMKNLKLEYGEVAQDMYLFPAERRGGCINPSTLSHWVRRQIQRYFPNDPDFVGVTFRSLRTYVGTELSEVADAETAQLVLWHKDIHTTFRFYIKTSKNRKREKVRLGLQKLPMIHNNRPMATPIPYVASLV